MAPGNPSDCGRSVSAEARCGESLSRRGFLKAGAAALAPLFLRGADFHQQRPDTLPILWHGSRTMPLLAVTIDDCYSLGAMHRLLEILRAHAETRLTFFPTGQALINTARRDPQLWPSLYEQGHEFGYHTCYHQPLGDTSVSGLSADLECWREILAGVVGEAPPVHFARPPYGDCRYTFQEFCQDEALTLAMWSADWGGGRAAAMERVGRTQPGDIVLMHGRFPDVDNLEPALAALLDVRLCKVTLSELASAEVDGTPEGKSAVCTCENGPKDSAAKPGLTPGDAE